VKVFQRTYTKPLPSGAKILRRRGGPVAQWTKRGKVHEAKLTAPGDRVLCASKNWFIQYDVGGGAVRTIKGLQDEQATRDLADKIERLLAAKATGRVTDRDLLRWRAGLPDGIRKELVQVGLIDAKAKAAADSLLMSNLLDGFERYLRLEKEATPHHVRNTISVIRRTLVDTCGFVAWNDIDYRPIRDCLLERRNAGKGISKRTFNQAVQAITHFCEWVLAAPENEFLSPPPGKLKRLPKEEDDRRRLRRTLSPDEARKLLETTMNEPERVGMTGRERALVYRFILETGLRAGECASLDVSDLDIDNPQNAWVNVRAPKAKSRKPQSVPIRAPLAAALKSFILERRKLPSVPVFGGRFQRLDHHTIKALQADLAAAQIPYKDESERYVDLHSLRYTFVTRLGKSGLDIDTVRLLARHASITTTQKYMDTVNRHKREGVNQLPDYSLPSDDGQAKRKTGTDVTG